MAVPSCSIIVPIYNAGKTLRRCVDSILSQTWPDFELILVNDGSRDDSREIIDEYVNTDSRVVAIHKPNGGVSTARNVGLDNATGKYIGFVDSDDEVNHTWLEAFFSCGRSDLMFQGLLFVDSKGSLPRFIDTRKGNNPKDLVELLIENSLLGFSPTKLFKNSLIQKYNLRFDEKLKFREDDVFVLQYIQHINTWQIIGDANYIYYVPENHKKYGTDSSDCIEQVVFLLRNIYSDQIPKSVCERISWNVKGAAIDQLLKNRVLSENLIEMYSMIVAPYSKGIKSKIIDMLIINSNCWGIFATSIIRMIHAMLVKNSD